MTRANASDESPETGFAQKIDITVCISVNRSPIRYGYCASAKAIRYSVSKALNIFRTTYPNEHDLTGQSKTQTTKIPGGRGGNLLYH